MNYLASPTRYDSMPYACCGRSGLKLPAAKFWRIIVGVVCISP